MNSAVGLPAGWGVGKSWSATTAGTDTTHAYLNPSNSAAVNTVDENTTYYVALQVIANDYAPVLTSSGTVSVAENSTGTIYTATSTDLDGPGSPVSYKLGGTDAARFSINASTGVLTFNSTPNFEAPTDSGANNVYDITITASDGLRVSAPKSVAITVTNVLPTVTAIISTSWKKLPMKMTESFCASPMPAQRMSKGMKALAGR